MNLVIGAAFLLALVPDKVFGSVINDYGDGSGELQNVYDQAQNQNFVYGDIGSQDQANYASNEVAHQAALEQQAAALADSWPQINEAARNQPQWQGGFQASRGIEGGDEQGHVALTNAGNLGAPEQYAYASQLSEGVQGLNVQGQGYEQAAQIYEQAAPIYENAAQGYGNGGLEYASEYRGSNIGELAGHGIQLGGHNFADIGHIDLKPKVEVQHHHIPTKTIEHTKPVHVPVVKKVGYPVPHAVGVPTAQVIKVPVPQPYAVHVPVPHPISVPIYKLVPKEIEKRVPIEVEKLVPVYVDKPYKIEVEKHHVEYVDKPYAVHVPVYKHIYHHVAKHHSDEHSGGSKD